MTQPNNWHADWPKDPFQDEPHSYSDQVRQLAVIQGVFQSLASKEGHLGEYYNALGPQDLRKIDGRETRIVPYVNLWLDPVTSDPNAEELGVEFVVTPTPTHPETFEFDPVIIKIPVIRYASGITSYVTPDKKTIGFTEAEASFLRRMIEELRARRADKLPDLSLDCTQILIRTDIQDTTTPDFDNPFRRPD